MGNILFNKEIFKNLNVILDYFVFFFLGIFFVEIFVFGYRD